MTDLDNFQKLFHHFPHNFWILLNNFLHVSTFINTLPLPKKKNIDEKQQKGNTPTCALVCVGNSDVNVWQSCSVSLLWTKAMPLLPQLTILLEWMIGWEPSSTQTPQPLFPTKKMMKLYKLCWDRLGVVYKLTFDISLKLKMQLMM